MSFRSVAGTLLVALAMGTVGLEAQESPRPGVQVTGLPAINYDSDEGFGYGAVVGIYRYGEGGNLYLWALEPSIYFTTNGRREVFVFADAPFVFGGDWRVSVGAGFSGECCVPYYGLGNASVYDPARAEDASPPFYRYDRDRWIFEAILQWRVRPSVRLLGGFSAYHNSSESGGPDTRFAEDLAASVVPSAHLSAASVGPKLGIVYDTRDHERDPHRGVWLDALVWQGLEALGSEDDFTRVTGTARGYLPLGSDITLAARLLAERVAGTLPVSMLPNLGSSFRDFEGVGGAGSVRGVFRARFIGRSRFLSNTELRWRGRQFNGVGQRWRIGLVAFVDAGRVWDDVGPDAGAGLHWGKGAGVRWTMGDAFVVAIDIAHGDEAGLQTYMGLGHLF
jgi:hypothetical protein